MSYLRLKIKVGEKSLTTSEIDYLALDREFLVEANNVVGEYAPKIVSKAKMLLDEKIIHRERSTGRLGRSIGWRSNPTRARKIGITIYAGAPYARFVEDDTRPHMIYPVRARLLRWIDYDGMTHFAVTVRHPGTRGKHMMRDAWNTYRLAMSDAMRRAMERAMSRVVRS